MAGVGGEYLEESREYRNGRSRTVQSSFESSQDGGNMSVERFRDLLCDSFTVDQAVPWSVWDLDSPARSMLAGGARYDTDRGKAGEDAVQILAKIQKYDWELESAYVISEASGEETIGYSASLSVVKDAPDSAGNDRVVRKLYFTGVIGDTEDTSVMPDVDALVEQGRDPVERAYMRVKDGIEGIYSTAKGVLGESNAAGGNVIAHDSSGSRDNMGGDAASYEQISALLDASGTVKAGIADRGNRIRRPLPLYVLDPELVGTDYPIRNGTREEQKKFDGSELVRYVDHMNDVYETTATIDPEHGGRSPSYKAFMHINWGTAEGDDRLVFDGCLDEFDSTAEAEAFLEANDLQVFWEDAANQQISG